MPTLHVFVRGRVQGVFFRQSTREKASALGLSGWVRNLADGRVELQASGDKSRLEELLRWCAHGPPHAHVEDIEVSWDERERSASGFSIA